MTATSLLPRLLGCLDSIYNCIRPCGLFIYLIGRTGDSSDATMERGSEKQTMEEAKRSDLPEDIILEVLAKAAGQASLPVTVHVQGMARPHLRSDLRHGAEIPHRPAPCRRVLGNLHTATGGEGVGHGWQCSQEIGGASAGHGRWRFASPDHHHGA